MIVLSNDLFLFEDIYSLPIANFYFFLKVLLIYFLRNTHVFLICSLLHHKFRFEENKDIKFLMRYVLLKSEIDN